MDGKTYGRKISPFYRTTSPIGAAALPPPMKTKAKEEQGKGTADHLMPLGYLLDVNQRLYNSLFQSVSQSVYQALSCLPVTMFVNHLLNVSCFDSPFSSLSVCLFD